MTNHEQLLDFVSKTHLRYPEIASRIVPPFPRIMNTNVLSNMIKGNQTTPGWVVNQLDTLLED